MKKIYSIILGVVIMALMTSCNDILDATPDGRKSIDEIFQDPELTAAYFSTCFNNIPRRGTRGCYFFSNGHISMSDEGYETDDASSVSIGSVYRGMASPSSFHPDIVYDAGFDGGYWQRYFTQIRTINQFLEKIPTAALAKEDDRARWTAEAYVLRAFFYLELIKCYGGVPISTEVYPLDYDYSKMERASYVDCAKQIIGDCQVALNSDALPWRLTSTTERWRMTKAIAAAIQSQAALYAASPLNNRGENLWDWAYGINKESYTLLKANGYELYTVVRDPSLFDSPYHEYFAMVADLQASPRDRETIWQSFDGVNGEESAQDEAFLHGVPIDDCYKAGVVPTQNLVDAYDMLATGKSVLDLANPYIDNRKLQPNYTSDSGYDPENPYQGRDTRFYATVFHNNSFRFIADNQPGTIETFIGGNCELRNSDSRYTKTGYYLKKRVHPHSTSAHRVTGGGIKYYRLGEVYLNLAEVAIEKGTAESIAEGMSLINEIRHRAGFASAVDLIATTQAEARLYLRHERQVELAYEEHRFFDVRRWCGENDETTCEKYAGGMRITKDLGTGKFTYVRFNVGTDGDAPSKMNFEKKYKRYPIPQDEAVRMEVLTGKKWQNPGW